MENMLVRTLKLGWSAVLLVSWAGQAQAGGTIKTPVEIYDDALESVVTLEVVTHGGESFVGSGFVAGRPGLIATAWHVVHDARSMVATFADGTEFDAFKIPDGVDAKHDLALLQLEKPYGRPVEFAAEPARVASKIYVIGAPRGYSFSIVDGLISQLQQVDGYQQYQISCPISPGNSGAPLIDERGAVVGVVSWSKRGAQNLNFAVPTAHLAGLLQVQSEKLPELRISSMPPAATVATASDGPPIADGEWARMQRYFSAMSGKSATIRVLVDGRVEEFDLVLPAAESTGTMLVGGKLGE